MGRVNRLFVVEGARYGKGVVVEPEVLVPYVRKGSTKTEYWRNVRLRCDCGTEYLSQIGALNSGKRISCGCARSRPRSPESVARMHATLEKRGKITEHPLYATWSNMKRRCYDQGNDEYKNYGARGIRVYEPWHDSRTFIAWIEENLGPRPKGHTLNRIDNDGNYEPGNMEWSSLPAQSRNKRKFGSAVRHRGGDSWGFRLSAGGFSSREEALAAQRRAVDVLLEAGILR